MRTLFLLALSATAITAYAQEAMRDTIDKYIINRQQVAHFDGSQLNGKLISKYTIAYKNSGNVVEKNHVIFTAGYSDVPSRKGVNDVITTSVRIAENDVISVATTNEVGYSTDKDALLIVDGNVISSEEYAKVEDIVYLTVINNKDGKAEAIYGDKARNGVIIATTKNYKTDYLPPLFVVDGKEITDKEFGEIKADNIASMTILKKGSDAAREYGGRLRDVIVVETKRGL